MSRKHAKWVISALSLILGLILLFNVAGDVFVREVAQDIKIEQQNKIPTEEGLDIGDKVPPWTLDSLGGDVVSFSDLLGAPTVITFWATWNENSTDQLAIFQDINTEGIFNIVAINNQEDASTVSNFISRSGYNITVLLDEAGEVGEEYGIRVLPVSYFIDSNGVLRETFVGVLSRSMLNEKISLLFNN
ncbi:MAG: TlpA disulfide reductase family protein [Candidatus Spechtbacterales bacterium]|nr:TlpA disulfide reductase family protein [Candidatus Spechtbacterales bacterium]